ncbi:hypothetical protein LTR91_006770 [Friedmanniomyces endolithicus]|uniref:FAD dependent oxidoreductase domain-containing protein n=1 Tax=Friedmanniomyces endolithicus TaxID=329885 RepID=A0A4U0UJC1_9PEZI|nr:hypothetical protein LTS09_001078 [Friedmanniomyces endolithicus]KAK0354558.1 hypothetical protein LTR94_011967 [Friedmanniomyces endolithicus]KAK0783903.1 hypothetical protein LTR59_011614 [Friedmanniomyces endolithicus]KAK0790269.1 hypothetical protein LTR38_010657 [Friedmanniomyces endolithicus]KAK0837980.1 hypothetical protein LTR03_012377 [Friedmanniomyces endolithicus]
MSTAMGGASQPPNEPPADNGSSKEPDDKATPPDWPVQKAQNGHNDWTKNSKIKTAKCDICSERIKIYSWQCDQCLKRICSECAEITGTSLPRYKFIAADSLGQKCGCAYLASGGQPPYLNRALKAEGLLGPPPKRLEEHARDKKIRNDVIQRKRKQAEEAGEAGAGSAGKADTASGGKTKKRKSTGEAASTSKMALPGAYEDDMNANLTIACTKFARLSRSAVEVQELTDSDGQVKRPKLTLRLRRSPKITQPHEQERKEEHVEAPAPAPVRCPYLDKGETVIVGAGITGLCIALELATKAKATDTRHAITVVDVRSSHCELAARGCAGILSTKGLDPRLDQLAGLALEAWNEFAESTEMREATGLVEEVYSVRRFNGEGKEHRPSWFTGFGDENFVNDEQTMGMIDTAKFGQWLFEECLKLDVKFFFNHHCVQAEDGSGIVIQNKMGLGHDDGARKTLACQNLVITAGPYTTTIFDHLYPASPLKIANKAQFSIWLPVTMDKLSDKDNVGLVFPDLAAEDAKLEDRVTMVGRPASGHIIVTGLETDSMGGSPGLEDALDLDIVNKGPIRHLRRLAGRRLGEDAVTPENAPTGCALVSTSARNLPVIAKVPASALGTSHNRALDDRLDGVWLCFGFGMRGTTLAPGAARALCRRLFGEESGMQDNVVGFPGLGYPV